MRVGEDGEGWEGVVQIVCGRECGSKEGLEERVTEVGVVGHGCGIILYVVCFDAETTSRVALGLGLETINPARR